MSPQTEPLQLVNNGIMTIQALINAESSQYIDSKGKTVMHQAAEQVGFSAFSVFCLSFSPFSFSLLYSLRSLLSSSQVKVGLSAGLCKSCEFDQSCQTHFSRRHRHKWVPETLALFCFYHCLSLDF